MTELSAEHPAARLPYGEFVSMVALLMALNAMAVDVILPALQQMGEALSITDENTRQLPLTAYIVSFGLSQLVYGTISDHFGRRPVLLIGLVIYVVGCTGAAFADNFNMLLVLRFIQGIGAGATRVIAMSAVRDTYGGRKMASVMSLAIMVFMVVPIIAPTAGQAILLVAGWRWIFGAIALFGLAMTVWCALRLPETLADEDRRSLKIGPVLDAFRIVVSNRVAAGYAIGAGLVFGCIFGFLNSAQQIYQETYRIGALFPLAFSAGAILLALTSFANSRLVERLGMRRLSHSALLVLCILSASLCVTAISYRGTMPLAAFFLLTMPCFGAFAFLGTNFNALAMDPLGHVAGTGSSVVSSLQTFLGGILGALIGQAYDGTVLPLCLGFLVLSVMSLGAIVLTEPTRLFGRNDPRLAGTIAPAERP